MVKGEKCLRTFCFSLKIMRLKFTKQNPHFNTTISVFEILLNAEQCGLKSPPLLPSHCTDDANTDDSLYF